MFACYVHGRVTRVDEQCYSVPMFAYAWELGRHEKAATEPESSGDGKTAGGRSDRPPAAGRSREPVAPCPPIIHSTDGWHGRRRPASTPPSAVA